MAHKNKENFSPYKARQQKRANPSGNTTKPDTKPAIAELKGKHKVPDKIYSLNEANDRIYDIFRNHDFGDFPHEQRTKLAQFYVLLMENQKTNNFTRLVTLRDVAIRHFIDCIVVSRITKLSFPLMDMGSGPGFPGIPLQIALPEQKIILAEGVGKRVEFLNKAKQELGLVNMEVFGRNIKPQMTEPKVRGVITRAVEDARNTLKNALGVLEVGGRVYLMKGPGVDPELKLAESMKEFYELEKDIAYELPRTPHKRRLLIYKKIKHPEDLK